MTVAADAERQKQEVADWVAKHVSIDLGERQGFACHLSARAVLNLSAANAFELLTHPQNACEWGNWEGTAAGGGVNRGGHQGGSSLGTC